jgi:phosphotransferase system HPr (HPr) family protein
MLSALTNRFRAEIVVECDGERIDGKSMMGWMMIPGAPGTRLTVYADGPDEAEALDALQKLVEQDKFFEG